MANSTKKSEVGQQDVLLEAARIIAAAVSSRRVEERVEHRNDRRSDARIQWASKSQEAGNLVFAGTVIAQALATERNYEIAVFGLGVFVGTYWFAYRMTRGGGEACLLMRDTKEHPTKTK